MSIGLNTVGRLGFLAGPPGTAVRLLLAFMLLCALGALSAAHAAGTRVGEVVMSIGEVAATNGGKAQRALRVGDPIEEGDAVTTGSNGYLYVKTADSGFISLRPNTRASFEIYRFDPAKPGDTRIRISMEQGVMRSISGRGAQAARDKYRLNTPIAAIGIRGTDFSVYADANVTRVSVRSGGITMAPIGGNCARAALGPCNVPNAADLDAGRPDALLQLRKGEQRPALLDAQLRNLAPDRIAPPLPDENSRSHDAASSRSSAVSSPVSQTLAARQEVGVHEQVSEARVTPPVPPPVPVESQAVHWGRWKALVGEAPEVKLTDFLVGGRELIGLNPLFALARDTAAPMVMPGSGVFDFSLQSHESYFYDASRQTVQRAQIQNPSLTVDFNVRSFATQFDVVNDTQSVNVRAKGGVTLDGEMRSGVTTSNADVRGTLAGSNADQAGLMFSRRIDAPHSAGGATFWRR